MRAEALPQNSNRHFKSYCRLLFTSGKNLIGAQGLRPATLSAWRGLVLSPEIPSVSPPLNRPPWPYKPLPPFSSECPPPKHRRQQPPPRCCASSSPFSTKSRFCPNCWSDCSAWLGRTLRAYGVWCGTRYQGYHFFVLVAANDLAQGNVHSRLRLFGRSVFRGASTAERCT